MKEVNLLISKFASAVFLLCLNDRSCTDEITQNVRFHGTRMDD
nr:MAG TPA: hypothetical protein [Caudoviricetes sp.]